MTYCLACLEHRRSSAANTQNSPNVRVSDLRRAHCRAQTSISNTRTITVSLNNKQILPEVGGYWNDINQIVIAYTAEKLLIFLQFHFLLALMN